MNTHFDASDYVRAHGRTPQGRGDWLFESPTGDVVEEAGQYAAARARVASRHPDVDVWQLLP